MIVVRVYVWPKGNEKEARLLGNLRIENVGPVEGVEDASRYNACFGSTDAVHGLPSLYVEHVRKRGFWRLVSDALNGALVKREENMLTRRRG